MRRTTRKRSPMIVKVQVPIVSSEPRPMVLIYDQRRTVEQLLPLSRAVKRALAGDLKSFWYAHTIPDPSVPRGVVVSLDARAPWQEW